MSFSFNNFSDIVKMAATADWSQEFRNLIQLADEKASNEDKQAFTQWFADQDFHDLMGIESNSVPSDHFEFAGDSWEPYMGN